LWRRDDREGRTVGHRAEAALGGGVPVNVGGGVVELGGLLGPLAEIRRSDLVATRFRPVGRLPTLFRVTLPTSTGLLAVRIATTEETSDRIEQSHALILSDRST
jgi:hypothetical protein